MSLRPYFLSFISSLLLIGCSEKEKENTAVDYFLSKDPSVLFQIHQKDQFLSEVINNDFWKNYFKYYPNTNVQNLLRSLPKDSDIWIAYTHQGAYISTYLPEEDTSSPWKDTTLDQLDSLTIENKKWYYIRNKQQLIISSLKDITIPTETQEKDPNFQKIAKTVSQEVSANLFLNEQKNEEFLGGIFPEHTVKYISQWSAWDILLDKNTLRLNGSSLRPADSLPQLPVTNVQKVSLESASVIPHSATHITSFAFEEELIPTEFYFDFQQDVSSVAFFSLEKDSLGVITSTNPTETLRYFTVLKTDNYQGEEFYHIEEFSDIQSFSSIFENNLQPKYLYRYNEQLIFSSKKESIQQVINAIQTKNTLADKSSFQELQEKNASQTAFITIENLSENTTFSKKFPQLTTKYKYASLQISPQNDFYLLTLTATAPNTTQSLENQEAGVQEKFQITLDKDAISPPYFVTNHRTGRKEVVIQDAENQLYLISEDGKVLWKRRLDAPIISDIFQVDLFLNGFLQLAFNTDNSLYIIDRNGNNVVPPSYTFKEFLLPLQIFDYEKTKDYRFVVCSDKVIYLLDKKAYQIKGFEKSRVPEGILQTPRHFRITDKDFIVFPEKKGTLNILHRNGTVRIPLQQKFNFSDNPITTYKGMITFTTQEGKQFFIDTNGGIRSESLGINAPHFFDCVKDIPVLLSSNILTINQKKIELPFAEYTRPRFHQVGERILISVTDLQNYKLYVFNSEGESLPDFPIFAASQAAITSENGKLLFAFLKEKNVISVNQ